jgi:hypothetical protein
MKKVTCPYCGSAAELQDAFVIYRQLGYGDVYVCGDYPSCDSYVGVHSGTDKPKGSLAQRELRELRKKSHALIDPLWRADGLPRDGVYRAAAQVLNLKEFHIGDMREKEAQFFVDNFATIVGQIRSVLDTKHTSCIAPGGVNANLVGTLKYLYVESQRLPKEILPYRAYQGHMETFKAGIEANLLSRIQVKETRKVFFKLTPTGKRLLQTWQPSRMS